MMPIDDYDSSTLDSTLESRLPTAKPQRRRHWWDWLPNPLAVLGLLTLVVGLGLWALSHGRPG